MSMYRPRKEWEALEDELLPVPDEELPPNRRLDHAQLPPDPELEAPRDALNEAQGVYGKPKAYTARPSTKEVDGPKYMEVPGPKYEERPSSYRTVDGPKYEEKDAYKAMDPRESALQKLADPGTFDAGDDGFTRPDKTLDAGPGGFTRPDAPEVPLAGDPGLSKSLSRNRLGDLREATSPGAGMGEADLGKMLSQNRLQTLRNATGPGRGRSPAAGQAKALVARAEARGQPQDYPDYPAERETAVEVDRTALQPRQDGGAPPEPFGGPVAEQEQLETPPPPAMSGEREPGNPLEEAQRRARIAEREAKYAAGMGRAADIISGTRYNDRAGEDIRAAGQQGVEDVLAQEAQTQRQANESRALEDQGFQRQGEQRSQGLDRDRQTTFGNQQKTFADQQEGDVPGHPRAQRLFRAAQALYPAQTRAIDGSTLSENNVKTLLQELAQQKAAGGHGAGGGAAEDKEVIQRAKMIPKNAKGIYDMLENLDRTLEAAGGKAGVQGVGGPLGLASLRPGITMNAPSQEFRQLRQQISNMSSNQLFGSALSPTEAGRFDKAVSDVAAGNSLEQVMGGMRVIKEMTKSAYEQSQAGASPGARARIEKDMGALAKPLPPRESLAPAPRMIRLKSGELVELAD